MKVVDLTGKRFGRLLVKEECGRDKKGQKLWLCICDCTNIKITNGYRLQNGDTKSCGCLNKEMVTQALKKYNTYDLFGEYGIGYFNNGECFYFDLEDYEKIKNYCWYKTKRGYAFTHINTEKQESMHRIIMDSLEDEEVDHKSRNKLDNRKSNLRTCVRIQNGKNLSIATNNTSGVTGVHYDKSTNKWIARITCDNEVIRLGCFTNFEDAVKIRLEAEEKYFGEFAPKNKY